MATVASGGVEQQEDMSLPLIIALVVVADGRPATAARLGEGSR
jgi:hypothetical protein